MRRAMIVSQSADWRSGFWFLRTRRQGRGAVSHRRARLRLLSLLPHGAHTSTRGTARRKAEVCPQACALRAQGGSDPDPAAWGYPGSTDGTPHGGLGPCRAAV